MPFSQSAKLAAARITIALSLTFSVFSLGPGWGSEPAMRIEIRNPGCAACVKKALSDLEASGLEGVDKIELLPLPGRESRTLCIAIVMRDKTDKSARERALRKIKDYLKSLDFEILRIR